MGIHDATQVKYSEQPVLTYHANPFIEALPPIIDKEEFFRRMLSLPFYDESIRSAPDHIRAHAITDGFDFFLPLPRHHTLHTCVDRMMRRGYLARNPIKSPLYWKLMEERLQCMNQNNESAETMAQRARRRSIATTSDLTAALIGASGCGKTTALRMECAFIPQLKEHGTYHGQRVNIRQLTWLWVETPHRGSPLDLCISILCALDEALDTNYERMYGQRELKVVKCHVARLMAVHAVGLLIIDEIQDISNVKSGGDKALAGFFLKLNNMLKIPILMVGTYKAEAMLQQQMRHTRRSTGVGLPSWDPLSRTLKEWDTFLEFLWQYQYTKTPTALTEELADTLFDECQGIPDFAVKAYFLCQDRLIATNSGKQSEKITAGLIRSVTCEYLASARALLQALRYKDREKLALLEVSG